MKGDLEAKTEKTGDEAKESEKAQQKVKNGQDEDSNDEGKLEQEIQDALYEEKKLDKK